MPTHAWPDGGRIGSPGTLTDWSDALGLVKAKTWLPKQTICLPNYPVYPPKCLLALHIQHAQARYQRYIIYQQYFAHSTKFVHIPPWGALFEGGLPGQLGILVVRGGRGPKKPANAHNMWPGHCNFTMVKVKIKYCNNERLLRCVAPPIGWGQQIFFLDPKICDDHMRRAHISKGTITTMRR